MKSNFRQHFFLLIVLVSTFGFSQDISIDQNIWGYEFKQGEQELTWKELLSKTESIPESYDLIKKAKSQSILSKIFGFTGGALIGIPVGQAIGNGEVNWVLAIAGGALTGVTIHLSSRSNINLKEGVSTYNSKNKTSFLNDFQPEMSLIGNAGGLGLRVRF